MPRLLTFTACALLAGFFLVGHSAQAQDEAIKNIPTANLDWDVTPEGVAFAPLIGDRFAEAYMAMVRLPAGLVSPAHVKSANMFGVMVSGSMTHSAVDADPKDAVILSEGSFYKIPKGVAHVSRCVSEVECVTFLYQDGKFDFLQASE